MLKAKKRLSLESFNEMEKGVIWQITDHAANLPVTRYAETVGVKVPEALYRSGLYAASSGSRLIGETYLLNAKRSSLELGVAHGVYNYASSIGVKGALSQRQLQEQDLSEHSQVIQLPRYAALNVPLGAVLRSRSQREMSGKPLKLEQLATLLYYADGPSGQFDFNTHHDLPATETLGPDYKGVVRTSPSGGGLYPVSLYLVAINVKGLARGLYRYLPLSQSLQVVRVFSPDEQEQYFRLADFGINVDSRKLGAAVYYVYSLYDNSRKYGDMALQFANIEAGEIAENLQLAATALDLPATDIGGYEKGQTEQFMGLDGLTRHIIHLTLVGRS